MPDNQDPPIVAVTVMRVEDDFFIDEKRVHFPFIVSWKCPKCGEQHDNDYSKDFYIGSPSFNEERNEYVNCYSCNFEGTFKYKLNIEFQVIT